uniref:Uncharacterized protein n=1 Tax=Timema monikensis TaxID=170555 RepID=A0A7R9ED13_9NEOP|nr:unnamed protein product [Timema monikensis]
MSTTLTLTDQSLNLMENLLPTYPAREENREEEWFIGLINLATLNSIPYIDERFVENYSRILINVKQELVLVSPTTDNNALQGAPPTHSRIEIMVQFLKYQINITQPKQPMLVSRSKPRELRAGMSELVYLVPELCRMTGLTDEMRANFHLMRALAEHTRVGPDIRIQKLNNFCNRLLGEQAVRQDLEEWNLQLSNRLVEFNGRILPQEKILQAQDIKYDAGVDTDWTRNLRRVEYVDWDISSLLRHMYHLFTYSPVRRALFTQATGCNPLLIIPQMQFWVVIVPNRCARDAGGFIQTLIKAAGGMRFIMPKPQVVEIPDDRAGTYVNALENVISGKNPQLIMCIVSNNRIDRYSAIKKKCCVDRAVPTQVILAKNLASKGVMSIATKVAIQINCKTGGAPWTVDVPLTNLMIVGFDVCHDTTDKGKSYGAMVASLNKSLSRYFSAVSAHTSGEELSSHLAANMTKALRKYQEHNHGNLPGRIVFYRDGVGEGQIPYVYLTEDQLDKIYGGTPVKMAFIIVTKRINTRIFLKGGNPPPGTVVDDCITIPDRYDFYLVSQSVRQGTVSPTSYNVISDNIGLDPDKLQRLTYKLTHLYYNWSVSSLL